MKIELRTLVKSVAALGAAPADWGALPHGHTGLGVVMNVVSDNEGLTMDGPDGFGEARVQIDVYSESVSEVDQVSRAIRKALHGHSDSFFQGIEIIFSRDMSEEGPTPGTRTHRIQTDYTVIYTVSE